MNCPNCGASYTICTRCIGTDGTSRRRRQCVLCKYAFWTVERIESEDRHQAFQASLFQVLLITDDTRPSTKI